MNLRAEHDIFLPARPPRTAPPLRSCWIHQNSPMCPSEPDLCRCFHRTDGQSKKRTERMNIQMERQDRHRVQSRLQKKKCQYFTNMFLHLEGLKDGWTFYDKYNNVQYMLPIIIFWQLDTFVFFQCTTLWQKMHTCYTFFWVVGQGIITLKCQMYYTNYHYKKKKIVGWWAIICLCSKISN